MGYCSVNIPSLYDCFQPSYIKKKNKTKKIQNNDTIIAVNFPGFFFNYNFNENLQTTTSIHAIDQKWRYTW